MYPGMNNLPLNYSLVAKFRFIVAEDDEWGRIIDPINKTFNGMIGMVQNNVSFNLVIGNEFFYLKCKTCKLPFYIG